MMSVAQQIMTIGLMAAGVMLTRFLPFVIFPPGRPTPPFVKFLGRYLPSAVFGMLVVYCLKDFSLAEGCHGAARTVGVALTAGLHLWRRSLLLSFAGGTVGYMALLALGL